MLSEAYGGQDMKRSSISEWHDGSKRVARTWKMTKKKIITFITIKGIHSTRPNSQPNLLYGDPEAVT
jgi:hypothetical protein